MIEILNRLKEPSSMAGIAVILQLITGRVIPPEMLSGGIDLLLQIIVLITGGAAIVMKEKRK